MAWLLKRVSINISNTRRLKGRDSYWNWSILADLSRKPIKDVTEDAKHVYYFSLVICLAHQFRLALNNFHQTPYVSHELDLLPSSVCLLHMRSWVLDAQRVNLSRRAWFHYHKEGFTSVQDVIDICFDVGASWGRRYWKKTRIQPYHHRVVSKRHGIVSIRTFWICNLSCPQPQPVSRLIVQKKQDVGGLPPPSQTTEQMPNKATSCPSPLDDPSRTD